MINRRQIFLTAIVALLTGCGGGSGNSATGTTAPPTSDAVQDGGTAPPSKKPFSATEIARFDEPWAMTFVDNGTYALVSTKAGKLFIIDPASDFRQEVRGIPPVDYGGQGGLGDVIAAPDPDPGDKIFPIYLSWIEAGSHGTRGAVVGKADLLINTMAENGFALQNLKVIWQQEPKVSGRGHFSHRIVVAPDAQHIFISSGERQQFEPAQDMSVNLGKIVRLNLDGSIPKGNPFASEGGVTTQIWSTGHRNGLGLAFDSAGRLWESEMGPKGGDEINLIQRGANYGYPRVSNGSHYGGTDIPDHAAGDGFTAPRVWWNPSISPAGMAYYDGALFPAWRNSLLVAALSGNALIRLKIDGENLVKADHWPMGNRIREVEAGPDGAVWLLEDGKNARLLKLVPVR